MTLALFSFKGRVGIADGRPARDVFGANVDLSGGLNKDEGQIKVTFSLMLMVYYSLSTHIVEQIF